MSTAMPPLPEIGAPCGNRPAHVIRASCGSAGCTYDCSDGNSYECDPASCAPPAATPTQSSHTNDILIGAAFAVAGVALFGFARSRRHPALV